ncbi:MAG: hypothetical protein ACI8QI_000009 [Limisphaerales bacterium]|jgi:hypothetical protein
MPIRPGLKPKASKPLAGGQRSATTGKAAEKNHPGRDGSPPSANQIPGWHPAGVLVPVGRRPVVSLTLNLRLMAVTPPA